MHHISNILNDVNIVKANDKTVIKEITTRTFQLKALDQFQFVHLENGEQVKQLKSALDKARDWTEVCLNQRGLSFVITGGVGTGKTTIARNLMNPFMCQVVPEDFPELQTEYVRGQIFEASDLMKLFDDDLALEHCFGRNEIIVIDDAGTEEIRYTNERTEIIKRHKRYGRLFDYFYNTGKHIVVTSNIPLIVTVAGRHEISPEFIEIFGDKAFDRLYQMAKGFMCDLTGLPSYRRYIVQDI